jgi:hypothetical protein
LLLENANNVAKDKAYQSNTLAGLTDPNVRQAFQDEIRLYDARVKYTEEIYKLTIETKKVNNAILILERQKNDLTEDEQLQLTQLLAERQRLTKEIEVSKQAEVLAIQTIEAERDAAHQEALKRLRERVRASADAAIGAGNPRIQESQQFSDQLGELLDMRDEARILGDQQAFARLSFAIKAITDAREQSFRLQVEEIKKAQEMRELKGEELAIAQQLNELQEEFDQRRLELQVLIFQAIQDGNQEALKTLEDLLERTDKLKLKQEEQIKSQFDFIRQLSDTVKQSAQQATEQALSDLFTLSKGLGDIFRDFATSVLRSIAQLAAQQATKAIFKAIGLGFADGGLVRGPGTSRSDSIPARLSNGEFVMNADAVRYWGTGFMDSLNSMRSPSVAFAGAGGGSAGFARSPTVIMNVQTPDANSFRRSEGQIGRDAGEQLRRSVQRNG